MGKFAKGVYAVKHPEKYVGKMRPIFRSSWEHTFMQFLDHHSSVINWASESIAIPYRDPLTNKMKNYYPDFFMVYIDKNNVRHAEIIEIKPESQTGRKKTRSAINNAQIVKNHAKWAACLAYCQKNGLTFRLVTETQLFGK